MGARQENPPRDVEQAARSLFRAAHVGLPHGADCEPHSEESVGGSSRGWSSRGATAARRAEGFRASRSPGLRRRCATPTLRRRRDRRAIAPLVEVVRELNLYHGVTIGSGPSRAEALPEIARTYPLLAPTHSPGAAIGNVFEDQKVAQKSSQAFEIVCRRKLGAGLTENAPRARQAVKSKPSRLDLTG
jgi:hypothetical protein